MKLIKDAKDKIILVSYSFKIKSTNTETLKNKKQTWHTFSKLLLFMGKQNSNKQRRLGLKRFRI